MKVETLRSLSLVFLFFCTSFLFASDYDPSILGKEIAALNDEHRYTEAIKKIDAILSNKQTHADERFNAYVQKSLIYKRLYNYDNALHNLGLAERENVSNSFKDYANTKVLVEYIFVYFDLNDMQSFNTFFKQIDYDKLSVLEPETQGFFYTLLGVTEQRKQNYKQAETYYNSAIKVGLEKAPRHLPNVYRAKMGFYELQGMHDKVIESYNLGKKYADKYNMDYYKIIMEEALTLYYSNVRNYEQAFFSQKNVSELRSKYNANNQSGKLATLEKELLNQRREIEASNQNVIRNYLISTAVILVALVIALWRLYHLNRQKRRLVEGENKRMREKLLLIAEADANEKVEPKLKLSDFNLSKRHMEIIELVRLGKTNKEIGAELYISENTVKYHLKLIYEALGIVNRGELRSNF